MSVGPSHLSRRELLRRTALSGGGLAALSLLGSRLGAAPAFASPAQQSSGGTLIAASATEIHFDPYFADVPTLFVLDQVFGSLVDYRGIDPYSLRPQLADSWQETASTLTIKLRSGVTFHNGQELTSQDVLANIARAKDASIGHALSDTFNASLASAQALDQYTFKLTYNQTYPTKLEDLVNLRFILPESMPDVATQPVGSGPFRFVNYNPGDSLQLARADGYWESGKPYLDNLTVNIIPDAQARLANLQAGAVDVIAGLGYSDVALLQQQGGTQIASTPPGGSWFVNILNCAHKPFDDQRVRQAMNYSLNRDAVNQLAYFGLLPVTQSRYAPGTFWYSPKAGTFYSFDLQKAKSLLQEAGYGNGFETTIAINDRVIGGSKAMAQVWAADLSKIGVKLNIVERDDSAFFSEYRAGNYDIQAYGLGNGFVDPAPDIDLDSGTRLVDNKAHIETQPFFAEYKRLHDQGLATADTVVRKPIYDRLQEITSEQSWLVMLGFWQQFWALSPRVQGFKPTFNGIGYFGDVWLAS